MCHRSGASTTPSSEMNSATMSFRIGDPPSDRFLCTVSERPDRGSTRSKSFPGRRQRGAPGGCLDGPMRFLMTMNGGGPPADEQLYAAMGRFVEELTQAGVLLATGGLGMTGTHMSASAGRVTFTDGPYAE